MGEPSQIIAAVAERLIGTRGIIAIAALADNADPVVWWTPHTLAVEPAFLAYSVTKTFIATLCVLLAENGSLDLDQPIARFLPELALPRALSLRALLDHSAGLPDYGALPRYHDAVRANPSEPWSFDQFVAETLQGAAPEAPTWSYSNIGYMLVKRVLERATDLSLAELVAARITRPLGLERTFVASTGAQLSELCEARSDAISTHGAAIDVRAHYHPGWVAHGVIASTPSEVARFVAALFSGFLSAHSLERMTRSVPVPSQLTPRLDPRYGLGLMAPQTRVGRVFGHNGGGPGYSASVFHAPEHAPPATVCAMCAIEDPDLVEELVFTLLESSVLKGIEPPRSAGSMPL